MEDTIMPMDGVMLGFMARELDEALSGGRVDKVTQPEHDEIILTIRNRGENHALLISASANSARMHLTREKKNNPLEPPAFCMLMRKHVLGARVLAIRQIDGDRIAEIDFEALDEMGDYAVRTLVCEFMGKYSNLILTHRGGKIIDSVCRVTGEISRVREVLPGLMYERPPQQGKLGGASLTPEALARRLVQSGGPADRALQNAVAGLSPQTAREICLRAAGDSEIRLEETDAGELAARVCALMEGFPAMARPTLVMDGDGRAVDVTPFAYLTRAAFENRPMASLSEAQEAYFRTRDRAERIRQKAAALNRTLKNNIERCEKKLGLQLSALQDSERMEEYRVKGELLSASLYQLEKGMKAVELPNYYDENLAPLRIELDVKLSPAANAQRYFKLYQKARSARRLAAEQKQRTEEELNYLEGQLENLGKCGEEAELFEIRAELEREGYVKPSRNRREMKSLPPSRPLKLAASDGTVILVGKNNLQNDRLTASAQLNEVWLHAKDMPGSHVIIVGEGPSEETIGEAASLAAYYSKGREGSRVPVDYTLRRYVKKPSGAKPGFVIYTHQKTLYVQPREVIART